MPLIDPNAGQFDPGLELGSLYQQDAQNRISQARVAQQKGYVAGLAGHYGVGDVSSKVKGLSDSDLYDLAMNLVNARRKTAAGASPAPGSKPGSTGSGATPTPKVAPKTAPKPATTSTKRPAAPKVTTKTTTSKTTAKQAATTARPLVTRSSSPVSY